MLHYHKDTMYQCIDLSKCTMDRFDDTLLLSTLWWIIDLSVIGMYDMPPNMHVGLSLFPGSLIKDDHIAVHLWSKQWNKLFQQTI